jgi:hypothetical protein
VATESADFPPVLPPPRFGLFAAVSAPFESYDRTPENRGVASSILALLLVAVREMGGMPSPSGSMQDSTRSSNPRPKENPQATNPALDNRPLFMETLPGPRNQKARELTEQPLRAARCSSLHRRLGPDQVAADDDDVSASGAEPQFVADRC